MLQTPSKEEPSPLHRTCGIIQVFMRFEGNSHTLRLNFSRALHVSSNNYFTLMFALFEKDRDITVGFDSAI